MSITMITCLCLGVVALAAIIVAVVVIAIMPMLKKRYFREVIALISFEELHTLHAGSKLAEGGDVLPSQVNTGRRLHLDQLFLDVQRLLHLRTVFYFEP